MDAFFATRNALSDLEESLQCSACQQLLMEPCTLGNCPHLMCKACVDQYAGNSCPACHAPAWAKELQVKRELGMVVKLYRRICRLIDSGPGSGGGNGLSGQKNGRVQVGNQEENELELSDDDDDDDILDAFEEEGIAALEEKAPGKCGLSGSETEPMSISDVDDDDDDDLQVSKGLQRTVPQGSETESISLSTSDEAAHVKKRALQERPPMGNKGRTVHAKSGTQKQQPHGKGSGLSSTKEQPSGRKRRAANQQKASTKDGRSKGEKDENDPMTVYDFVASPSRPKTCKVKKRVVQQTKREVHLKRLAAANKTWGAAAVSHISARSNCKGKHVSFSEDSLMTGSSSAEDTDEGGNVGVRPSSIKARGKLPTATDVPHSNEDSGIVIEEANTSSNRTGSKHGRQANKQKASAKKSQTGQETGKSSAGKRSSKRSPQLKPISGRLSKQSDTACNRTKGGKSPTSSKKASPRNSPKTQGKKRNSKGLSGSKETLDLDEEDPQTPESSPGPSMVGRKRRSGLGLSSSPNSSFASPKSALAKRNKRGETPLHVACIKGDVVEVKSLLEQGADPNVKDNAGWTPLHEACNHGHAALLTLLLDNEALINAPGFEHDSPLHDAVSNYRLDVVRFLRERGASLETRNIHGKTPLDLATTAEMKKALMTPPLTDIPLTPRTKTPVTSPSQHLKDRQVVLLATSLSAKEKASLRRCARLLGGRVVEEFCGDVTHLVASCEEGGRCQRTMKYMQAVLVGRWVVTFKWVERCIKRRERVEEAEYEILGTTANPDSQAARRARENIQKQFPGLFDGCHFYFTGTFNHPTPPKPELLQLIKLGGGAILNRQPKPDDDVIQTSTVVPYHAKSGSALASCAHYVLYDHLGTNAPISIRSPKVCTVPVYWFLDCVSQFTILDPPRE